MQSARKITVVDYGEYEEVLQKSPLFQNLKTEVLSEFISLSSVISYPKNSVIYNIEDKADWFYFVLSGWVKLFRQTLDGDEAITDILGESEVFAECAVYEDFKHQSTAEAIEETVLIRLPIGLLADKVEHDANLANNLSRYINNKHNAKNKEIEHQTIQNAPQKIGCFLLRLCNYDQEQQVIELPFEKIIIASKLGMKPETFSRALAKLKSEAEIEVTGKTFKIGSLQKLSTYCCGACSSQFPCGS